MKKLTLVLLALALAAPAGAAVLFNVTTALDSGDATMTTRMNRNGVPSDWSVAKAFPGTFGTAPPYYYRTWTIPIIFTPFIQISVDDPSTAIFAAAYLNTFTPPPSATNYLGDAGSSGNPFGNPAFFQVVAPNGNNLVVVAMTPAGAANLNNTFNILVEGFIDTAYGIPEPSTGALLGGALLLLAVWRRRAR
jgi:hypothetical protein